MNAYQKFIETYKNQVEAKRLQNEVSFYIQSKINYTATTVISVLKKCLGKKGSVLYSEDLEYIPYEFRNLFMHYLDPHSYLIIRNSYDFTLTEHGNFEFYRELKNKTISGKSHNLIRIKYNETFGLSDRDIAKKVRSYVREVKERKKQEYKESKLHEIDQKIEETEKLIRQHQNELHGLQQSRASEKLK